MLHYRTEERKGSPLAATTERRDQSQVGLAIQTDESRLPTPKWLPTPAPARTALCNSPTSRDPGTKPESSTCQVKNRGCPRSHPGLRQPEGPAPAGLTSRICGGWLTEFARLACGSRPKPPSSVPIPGDTTGLLPPGPDDHFAENQSQRNTSKNRILSLRLRTPARTHGAAEHARIGRRLAYARRNALSMRAAAPRHPPCPGGATAAATASRVSGLRPQLSMFRVLSFLFQ